MPTVTAAAAGNWSGVGVNTPWDTGVPPVVTDDVELAAFAIAMDGASIACKSLKAATSTKDGQLTVTDAAARTIAVTGAIGNTDFANAGGLVVCSGAGAFAIGITAGSLVPGTGGNPLLRPIVSSAAGALTVTLTDNTSPASSATGAICIGTSGTGALTLNVATGKTLTQGTLRVRALVVHASTGAYTFNGTLVQAGGFQAIDVTGACAALIKGGSALTNTAGGFQAWVQLTGGTLTIGEAAAAVVLSNQNSGASELPVVATAGTTIPVLVNVNQIQGAGCPPPITSRITSITNTTANYYQFGAVKYPVQLAAGLVKLGTVHGDRIGTLGGSSSGMRAEGPPRIG